MAKVKIYNIEGGVVEELEVSDAVFGLADNVDLVNQVAVSLEANCRQVLADTKTRGERAGSGIKPWKQKGTGRARVGSKRTPLWKKGGVVFGPNNDRNFKKKINKKMNKKAVAVVLSGKLRDGEIFVLDNFETFEKKTKNVAKALNNLKIKGANLFLFSGQEKDFRLASRNLPSTENILAEQVNVLDLLRKKNVFMSKSTVNFLEKRYQA